MILVGYIYIDSRFFAMIPEVKLKFLIKEVKSVKISKMRVYAPAFMYLGACIGGCKEGVYLI